MGTSLQLEGIGVGVQNDHALIALQTAGSMENQHNTNVAELAIELSRTQSSMAELEWYKERCEKDNAMGYPFALKIQSDKEDIHADLVSLILARRFAYYSTRCQEVLHKLKKDDRKRRRLWESNGHNFGIKLLDPTKVTQEAYDMLVDIIEFFESLRLYKLFLRAMIRCFIAMNTFLSLKVESSDSKANIQDIKAKIQEKFNYNGNCNVKIGIIPERSGTSFLKMGVLRPTPTLQKVHSTQLVLRLIGAKHISREYDITSNVSKLSTSEAILLIRGF